MLLPTAPGRKAREARELDAITSALAQRADVETACVVADDGEGGAAIRSLSGGTHGAMLRTGFAARAAFADDELLEAIGREDTSLGLPGSKVALTQAASVPLGLPGDIPGALCAGLSRPLDADLLRLLRGSARLVTRSLGSSDGLGRIATHERGHPRGCVDHAAAVRAVVREIEQSTDTGAGLCCCFVQLVSVGMAFPEGLPGLGRITAAAALGRMVARPEVVGHHGKDRFVLVLPGTSLREAVLRARAVRSDVQAATMIDGCTVVQALVGVAEWHPGDNHDTLLSHADDGLRAAGMAGASGVGVARSAARRRRRRVPVVT